MDFINEHIQTNKYEYVYIHIIHIYILYIYNIHIYNVYIYKYIRYIYWPAQRNFLKYIDINNRI